MSVLTRLFSTTFGSGRDPRERLRPLWYRVVERSRDPEWYRECGVADTVAGRFDMIVAILALVLLRLERDPEGAAQTALLTELFVEDMDGQLRESGIGDIVVGKHMGRLISSLGGRLGAFREALADGDGPQWRAALERNVTLRDCEQPEALAKRLIAFDVMLAATPAQALLAGSLPQ